MSKYWETYDYKDALHRARDLAPEIKSSDDRFEIPRIQSNIEGNRTFLRNFFEIANFLNRKPTHFLKFLTSELGTSGNVDGNRIIFQGKHTRMQIEKALNRYVEQYVLCQTCGKPDTRLEIQDRILMMRCDACGASQAVRPIK